MRKQNHFQLPQIPQLKKTATLSTNSSQKSLQSYLRELKVQQMSLRDEQTSRMQLKYKTVLKTLAQSKKIARKQLIKGTHQDRTTLGEEITLPFTFPTIYVNNICTTWKPPNRYKTAIGMHDGNMIMYGGLGCEKNISWVKFSFKNMEWSKPSRQQNVEASIYGHSLRIYKGNAYIFGGTRLQSSNNELVLLSLKNMSISQLAPAPFRRKQHAMTIISKYLVVHGGLQSNNSTKNTLFYFDLQNSKWIVPLQSQLPFLSHHSMATIPYRSRKRAISLQDTLTQSVYLFGGINENSQQSDRLLFLKVKQGGQIAAEQIIAYGGPQARHSHCMQYLEPNYICIYGGRNNEILNGSNRKDGVFNDIYLFNIDTRHWIVPQISQSLQYRYGASCCTAKNKLIVFGGNSIRQYADGNIVELSFNTAQEDKNEQFDENINTRLKIL